MQTWLRKHFRSEHLLGIFAGAFFGASIPALKPFLETVHPLVLAGCMALGSGIQMSALRLTQKLLGREMLSEPWQRRDLRWFGLAIFAGTAANVVLMLGLQVTPAATASLLLGFESAATALLAALFFREKLGPRTWLAIGLVTLASILLSFRQNGEWGLSWGAIGVLAACFLWGTDTNYTRYIAFKNPFTISSIKGLVGGFLMLGASLVLAIPWPDSWTMLKGMAIGGLCYGMASTCFNLSLRKLGAAQSGMLFGTNPFWGVLLSLIFLQESLAWTFYLSFGVMLGGVFLLLTDAHESSDFKEVSG